MLTGIRGTTFVVSATMYALLLSSQLLGWANPGVWELLLIYTALSVTVLLTTRGRIEHPATLFTVIFWFYVAGYPIVVELGLLPDEGLTSLVLALHTIGYLGFVLPTLVRRAPKIPNYDRTLPNDSVSVLRLGIAFLVALGAIQMAACIATGSYKGGGWKYSILATSAPQLYVVAGASILLAQWLFNRYKSPLWLSVLTVVVTLAPILITGRRTPGSIAVLVLIMLLEIRRRRLNLLKLAVIVFAGFIFIGVSKQYGAIIITENHSQTSSLSTRDWRGLVGDLFHREFKTSGRLTAASIKYGETHEFPTYGAAYFERFKNSLLPGFLLTKNPTGIVQELNIFITGGGTDTGLGYSIIAEGYNNFGILGVFLNLFILGMITTIFYQRAGRSPVSLGSYVVFLALICARLRSGTLSVYLMSVYSLLLPIGLFCLARVLIYGRSSRRLVLSKRLMRRRIPSQTV